MGEWRYLVGGMMVLTLYFIWSAATEMGTRPFRNPFASGDTEDKKREN